MTIGEACMANVGECLTMLRTVTKLINEYRENETDNRCQDLMMLRRKLREHVDLYRQLEFPPGNELRPLMDRCFTGD